MDKKNYEKNLTSSVMVIEATCDWSNSFLKLLSEHDEKLPMQIDKMLFSFDLYQDYLTALAFHYNQLYFNDCILHLANILDTDKKIISLQNYHNKILELRNSDDIKNMQVKLKAYKFYGFRNEIIAHKSYKEITNLNETVNTSINPMHYPNIKELIQEIVNYMKANFEFNNIYLNNFDNQDIRFNNYKVRYNYGINKIIKLISKRTEVVFQQYCKLHNVDMERDLNRINKTNKQLGQ